MGKTYKDQANFYRFKNRDDMPHHCRDKDHIMDVKYKGYRSGNDRKTSAKSKVIARKQRRRAENPKGVNVSMDYYIKLPNSRGMK